MVLWPASTTYQSGHDHEPHFLVGFPSATRVIFSVVRSVLSVSLWFMPTNRLPMARDSDAGAKIFEWAFRTPRRCGMAAVLAKGHQ